MDTRDAEGAALLKARDEATLAVERSVEEKRGEVQVRLDAMWVRPGVLPMSLQSAAPPPLIHHRHFEHRDELRESHLV